MFWLGGTREAFGAAYFVSVQPDGAVDLWRSNRPYAANDRIGRVPSIHLTAADVRDAIEGG